MKKNNQLFKAVIPFMLLGTPALAGSSLRSFSRTKMKKVVTHSKTTKTTIEPKKTFVNPFNIFGDDTKKVDTDNENIVVLDFLKEEGLLSSSNTKKSLISGEEYRKDFAGTSCAIGATYNHVNIKSWYSSKTSHATNGIIYTSGTFYLYLLDGGYKSLSISASDGVSSGSYANTIANIKTACASTPTTITPTISEIENQVIIQNSAKVSIELNSTDTLYNPLTFTANISDTNLATLSVSQVITQLGSDIDGEASGDESGSSVSISSDGLTVAIGAPYNDGNSSNSGQVRIYKYESGTWNQLGSDIDGEASNDESGKSVSISSDGLTVAIGAPYNDGNSSNSGQVRIYKYESGAWNQLGLDIDGEASDDESGKSVSISADGLTVAIGATRNDDNGDYSGQVRIYKYESGAWNQLGLDIDGEASNDESGSSVSISADGLTVAIGSHYNDGYYGEESGQVRIYNYDGSSWNQLGSDIDGEASGDESGSSVSISSDGLTVAIGAPYNDGNGNYSGHVRIYKYDGDSWNQLGFDVDGEIFNDYSGESVSLSADGLSVAIGAIGNSNANGQYSGHVRVYKLSGETTNKLLITPTTDALGTATITLSGVDENNATTSENFDITLSNALPSIGTIENQTVLKNGVQTSVDITTQEINNVAMILTPTINNKNIASLSINQELQKLLITPKKNISGTTTVTLSASNYHGFDLNTSFDLTVQNTPPIIETIENQTVVKNSSKISLDINATDIDDNILNFTANISDPNLATVEIEKLINQLGSNIDGEASNDYSGKSVSISADGTTVAIGAYGNDDNGSNSGQVRIYKYDGGSWNQLGSDIDGEASDDESGSSVSLSLDGLSVAISAPNNSDKGTDSGQVRIYKYDGTSWNQIALDIDGEAGDGYNGISVSMSGL